MVELDNTARILARVRKMLALANDANASEGERDNAMRMAHATLAKYNLDMAGVEASGEKPQERRGIQQAIFYGRPWARIAARSIADMCFCNYLITPAKTASQCSHWFIGRESNAVTAAELASFVVKSIWAEGHKLARARGAGNEFARNFATGAAHMVAIRCALLRKESEGQRSDTKPGTALVLASVYQIESKANEEYMASSEIKTKTMKSMVKHTRNEEAKSAGMEYGNKVSLSRSITGKKQKELT